MLVVRPFVNMLRSRLGVARSLSEAATATELLDPAFREKAPPLVMSQRSLDRVRDGVRGHSTLADELRDARAPFFHHAEVTRHVLPDCLVNAGGVEYRGGRLKISPRRRDRLAPYPARRIDRAHFCMSFVSGVYFGHWLTDACTTALLAPDGESIILHDRPDWPDTRAYARAFGLATSRPESLFVGELVVYMDFAQGMLKRARYDALRARLRARIADSGAGDRRPVYLRRGSTGVARLIADEEDLCERLERIGFDIVDVATTGFAERFARLARASLLVSVEGSHINHAYFAMRPGCPVIALMPADRFTMCHRGLAHAFAMRFGCVVMPPSERGYRVPIDELMETIDMFGDPA